MNPGRQGAGDPRTQEAKHIDKIAREIQEIAGDIPVLKFLENVASAPRNAKDLYEEIVVVGGRLW